MLNKRLFACIMIVLMLCFAQIRGSTVLILGCLACYLCLLGWLCMQNFTLPILLFFLPWSPLMRTNPAGFSFFTFGIVLVCFVSVIKKKFVFRRYHIVSGIVLAFFTLLSKLLSGHGLEFSYIAFLMLIVLFPVVKEESSSGQYDFYQIVVFLSVGIISAALCAQWFSSYGNISKYIVVHSYLTIIRRMGFYGDPNFYTAQITAALGGGFYATLKENSKRRITALSILLMLLVYCGFLSGSKSFVFITFLIMVIWAVEMMRMRGNTGRKIVLTIVSLLAVVYIASSAIFGVLIDVLVTRFSFVDNLSSLTTHRTELWAMYFKDIFGSVKTFFLGEGFTNVKVNERGSHNTVLQMLYQLGILGTPVLVLWIICFFKEVSRKSRHTRKRMVSTWILLIGVFMPWLAIDMLFFDEFFLFQWYALVALRERNQYLNTKDSENPQQRALDGVPLPGATERISSIQRERMNYGYE